MQARIKFDLDVRQHSCISIMLNGNAAQLSNQKSKCTTPNLQLLFVYTAVTVTGESQQLQSGHLHQVALSKR